MCVCMCVCRSGYDVSAAANARRGHGTSHLHDDVTVPCAADVPTLQSHSMWIHWRGWRGGLSVYLSVCLFVCVCLSLCLSICLSVCLPVCLSVSVSLSLCLSLETERSVSGDICQTIRLNIRLALECKKNVSHFDYGKTKLPFLDRVTNSIL